MDEKGFIWEHFKFNADQRLKAFNFFILLTIFADGGVFAALEKGLSPQLLVGIGVFIVLLASVFALVDARSRNLLKITIPALKEIEETFPESHRLFAIDATKQGRFVRYTFAINLLLFAQMVLGIWVGAYGVIHWKDAATCSASTCKE